MYLCMLITDASDVTITDPTLIQTLRPGHKIARGRGRKKQLQKMSELEKKAETAARMEKMRISARECRLRKKHNIITLQMRIEKFAKQEKVQLKQIRSLERDITILEVQIAFWFPEGPALTSAIAQLIDNSKILRGFITSVRLQ